MEKQRHLNFKAALATIVSLSSVGCVQAAPNGVVMTQISTHPQSSMFGCGPVSFANFSLDRISANNEMFSAISFVNGEWCLASGKLPNWKRQRLITSENDLQGFFDDAAGDGYVITSMAGSESYFIAAATKIDGLDTGGTVLSAAPDNFVGGYRQLVTSIAMLPNKNSLLTQWMAGKAVLQNETAQIHALRSSYISDFIEDGFDNGFSVDHITQFYRGFLIFMSKRDDNPSQHVFSFDEERINELLQLGFLITDFY